MNFKHQIRHNASVVSRLRLAFVSVLFTVSLLIVISGYFLFELKHSQQKAIANSIPPLSLTLAIKVNEALEAISAKPTVLSLKNNSLSRDLYDQYQFLEISFRLSGLLHVIENLPTTYDGQNGDELTTDILFRFRNITRFLINV